MEKRDLYDENKKLTGETIFKGEPIPKGDIILQWQFLSKMKWENF